MKFEKDDILIPHDTHFPEGAVQVDGYDRTGRLLVHPLGGGLQLAVPADAASRFRLADEGERARALFRRAKFSLMDSDNHFTGWTNGEAWNGWEKPHFEFEEAQRLAAWLDDGRTKFQPERDSFVTVNEDDDEENWPATTVAVTDGSVIKTYPIGAGSWCWEEET